MSAGGEQSSGNQQSTSASNSFIAPVQQPYLQNLWGMANQQAGAGAPGMWEAQGANQNWLNQGMSTLTGLMDPSAQIAAQSASLQSGLGDMFQNEIMPSLDSNAIMSGGFGGGRQGVAQSNAVGELANAYTTGLGDITARANSQAFGAAGMVPSFATANMSNMMSGWDNLSNFASILGAPTVIQSSAGQSTGRNSGSGFNFGWSD